MSNETETKYLQIFSLTDLISAPLIATVQGDFYAAERFVTYLRKYGFEEPEAGKEWDFGKLRMVVFQYRTADGWMEMQIPLISLIPLPLLSVSDADFQYNLRIMGLIAPTSSPTRDPDRRQAAPLGVPVEPRQIMGAFAPLQRQSPVQEETPTLVANMDIKIRMRQSDLPAGIAAMLNVVQSAVEGTSRNRLSLTPAVNALTQQSPAAVVRAALLDRDGQPMANYLVRVTAAPEQGTEYLLAPEVVEGEGTLVSQPGMFSLGVLTNAAGVVGVRWKRGAAPKNQTGVTITASAEVDFPGHQFGPVNAEALLQILPSEVQIPPPDPNLAR